MPGKKTTKNTKLAMSAQDIEDANRYQKMEQREHVYKRPDTYVGSVEHNSSTVPIYTDGVGENVKDSIRLTKIEYVPALYKIFDEVLVNAIDQHTRLYNEWFDTKTKAKRAKINMVTKIDVNIDKEAGTIEVINNGKGIDIVFMEEHNMYPPGLIFGVLLTGENYDDEQQKTTGGKNGFGAKLANIFSNEFIIETVDDKRKLKYIQTFRNNMTVTEEPQIEKYTGESFTRVKFHPDYTRFNMTGMTDDVYALFKKRAWDTAAWIGANVTVSFNGQKIIENTFKKYATLYIGDFKTYAHEVCNSRWEIMATYNSNEVFEHYSFVNGINTIRGGKHVEYIVDQICDKMIIEIKKSHKMDIKKPYVRNQLMVFVKATIVNPSFDGQTKETLTTVKSKFGTTCEVSDAFIKQLAKTGIVERIVAQAEYKNNQQFKSSDGKKVVSLRGIDKYSGANKAGSRKAKDCTLILTEGDSAKTLVISGLTGAQRDYFGVFPLKGKLLNVKDQTIDKIANNDEIVKLKKILGLESTKDYSKEFAVWPLRYGKVMIMTDQDVDGSHIKGLIINYFDTFHPGLLKRGFITCMITPIVKVTKGKQVRMFYSEPDYYTWKDTHNNGKGWKAKYYKGLGTSNAKEAKEYFNSPRIVSYDWTTDLSPESIDLAFNKSRSDNRKTWIETHNSNNTLDNTLENVTYEDFFNKEFILFSLYSVKRAIPCLIDGHKPSQRKVIFSCLKRNLVNELKVAQLAGYVSEHSGYHHGEASLMGTIIKLSQNYVGSNNINLLMPNGQFGTRLMGGEDHASPRYIFTELNPLTKMLYSDLDKPLLNYLDDDGSSIEPEYYVPILPIVLINGCNGIATGWSTTVPCYNPIDIGKMMESKLTGKPYPDIKPWYNGFTGTISKINDSQYMSKGKYIKVSANTIRITELPIGTWTEKYIKFLESLLPESALVNLKKGKRGKKSKKGGRKSATKKGAKGKKSSDKKKKTDELVMDVKNNSTEVDVNITIRFKSALVLMRKMKEPRDKYGIDSIEKMFKLTSNINTSNMMLVNKDGIVQKYNSPYEIMDDFFDVRMDYYMRRKAYMLDILKKELNLISYKVKFIKEIINDSIDLRRKKRQMIDELLKSKGYPKLSNNLDTDPHNYSYDYLVKMSLDTLTQEKIDELERKLGDKQIEFDELQHKTERRLWVEDLKVFFAKYKKVYNIKVSKKKNSSGGVKPTLSKKTKKASKTSNNELKKVK
jgi:DNA topoisomerase-2